MNATQKYITERFNVNLNQPSPIKLPLSRYGMTQIISELNFKIGAEIGTEHGTYAQKICMVNPQLKLYCIDPWQALPYYQGNKPQKEVNTFYQAAKTLLAPYNCKLLKMTSMDAVKKFKPNSLDFVFIDGNHHLEFVVNDIVHWSRIVKPGGIIYGHDYSGQFHVRQAITAFMESCNIHPWFILHRSGLIDSWMYVRSENDNIFYS